MNRGDQRSFSGRRYGGPLLAVSLLIVAVVVVFGQVYGHKFLVWDDDKQVLENPHLNPVTWRGLGQLWQEPYWGLYIPLSYTFFAAEATIARRPLPDSSGGAPNPTVFHLGNLALHIACVLLVFAILRRLLRHDGAACIGALLFGLHPVQVETVAWISETRGTLCGVFSLLAVWQYLCHAGTPGLRKSAAIHYVLATVAFVMALLCKPAAVAAPLIAGVLDLGLLRRPWRRVLFGVGPWLILAAAWVLLTKYQQPDRELPFVPPLWARPLLAGDALAFYLRKLVVPLQLGPDYGRTPAWVMQQWWFYVAWMVPMAVVTLLACLKNRRVWLTAAAVFLAWLLPVLGFVPFVFQRISTVADRYLYLSLLGPALALSWFLARRWNRPTVGVATILLCLLGVLSFFQTTHWRNDDALLAHGLRVNPLSMVARHNRGYLLAAKGKHEEAIKWYREALADHPHHVELHLSLASSLVALGRLDEAIEATRSAVRQNPRQPLLYGNLGNLLVKNGESDTAMEYYRTALKLDPDCVAAHLGLGKLMLDRGESDAAIEHYRSVLGAVPTHVPAHVNLGAVLKALGRVDEARYHYRTALEIQPDSPAAHYNLAILLADEGSLDEAEAHYRAALKSDPDHARAHVNLGVILFEQGNAGEAIEHYRTALEIEPDLVQAHVHLGHALAAEGRAEEAAAAFRAALRLAPPDSELERRIRGLLEPLEWKNLFDGKTLRGWEVASQFNFINHGKVEVKDGTIVLGRGRPGTAIRFTDEFPKIDYELSLEAMRVEGEDFFCALTFPIDESPCTLIVGGWGGPVVGLSCIDDEPAAENETTTLREFNKNQWYAIRLRVTKAKVEAWIDKENVVDLPTEGRKFTIWFEPESVLPLGIATWETTGAMRNIRVRAIDETHGNTKGNKRE